MRFKWFAQAAACALLVTSAQGSADAKPKRPVASAAAKKKAAAAAAAKKKEDARLAAEAAAKAAAEAAEKARIGAQWGVLADIGEADFENEYGQPLTVRKNGEAIELTGWSSVARGVVRFERDPSATGKLTVTAPGQWSKKSFSAQVLADGSIEGTAKNETRWTVLAPDSNSGFVLAALPGGKQKFAPLSQGGKAATKLASLIAAGKVSAVAQMSGVRPTNLSDMAVAPAAQPQSVKATWEEKAVPLEVGRTIHYETSKKDKSDGFLWRVPCFSLQLERGKTYMVTGNFGSQSGGLGLWRGCTSTSGFIMSPDKYEPSDVRSIVFTKSTDAPVFIQVGMRGSGKTFDLTLKEMTAESVALWKKNKSDAQLAETRAKSQSSGNSGWLGGLIMGGVAAAAGADANIVMAATAQGVAMTTDDENMRATMTGISGDFIRNKAEIDGQKAELERLGVAAAEETRQKREAEAKAAADARDAKTRSDQQARDAEARELAAKAEQKKRDDAAAAEADKRRRAEEQRLAEQKRKQEEAARPIEFKEGVVLCEKKKENYYRCDGPLQVTYSDLKSASGMASIGQACGSDRWRDMGMAGSYRAFGCNFGMNPDGISPGNRDVPAAYGLFVERAIFHCPRSKDAYCQTR